MPIENYSVLKGDPLKGVMAFGRSPHYQITVDLGGATATVAVNVQSLDGSEVLYLVDHAFVPPFPGALRALAPGFKPLASAAGGLALDFVREQVGGVPLVSRGAMSLLSQSFPAGDRQNDLNNEVVDLLDRAIADQDGTLYAFGSAYTDGGSGIHDIHMNQGNPIGAHRGDNGIWQDGALFIELPQEQKWLAVFIAFQTQAWSTDNSGNPAQA